MKKLFITLLVTLCAAVGLAGLAACGAEEPVSYTVTVTCGEGGSYSLSPEGPFAANDEVTLTVLPAYGYRESHVTVGGQAVELTEHAYTFRIEQNTSAEIAFEKLPTHTLTVQCGEHGSYTIEHEGEVVAGTIVLTPQPDLGYEVKKVYMNGMAVPLTDGEYVLTVSSDCTVEIVFQEHLHSYGEWELTLPTLTAAGAAVRTCPNCVEETPGHRESVELPVLTDERYTVTETVPASCAETGEGNYSIEAGGETFAFTAETEKLPHNYTFTVREYPTENYGGVAEGTCSLCPATASGHTVSVNLPANKAGVYTLTGNTATCTERGTANHTVTVGEYTITFRMETLPLGHDFSGGTGKCSRCGEAEGVFDSRFVGTWTTDALPLKTLVIGGSSVTLDGKESSSAALGDRTDAGEQTFTFLLDGVQYTILAHEGRYNNLTRYYVLDVSYLHPDTHIRLTSQFFGSDYPVPAFEEAVAKRWTAGEHTIGLSGKTIYFDEELTSLSTYIPSANGFTLTFNAAGEEGGLSAFAAQGNYTLKYTKNNGALVLIENATGTQTTCEVDTSFEKVLIPEGYDGTYVSDDGAYAIVIDETGKLSFNGVLCKLDSISNFKFSFVVSNVAYNISLYFDQTALTLNSAALGIENVKLTRQNYPPAA